MQDATRVQGSLHSPPYEVAGDIVFHVIPRAWSPGMLSYWSSIFIMESLLISTMLRGLVAFDVFLVV
jgi:hypothetical protein